jgi:hypothetical protein
MKQMINVRLLPILSAVLPAQFIPTTDNPPMIAIMLAALFEETPRPVA